ncbi:hypothetical protein IJ076_00775 [Candidatus Saccharibacteria bacterium]|nr:hypothetical protein [Candidatus Saccharibacteria bacterium]
MRINKRNKWPLVAFIIGLLALAIGAVVLIIRLNSGPDVSDGDYLTQEGEWVREDNSTVIWDFTDIGNGRLTTDGHLNNYAFSWSIENGKLTIETDWLYDLNDEFDYKIDRNAGILTITRADKGVEVTFKAREDTSAPDVIEISE